MIYGIDLGTTYSLLSLYNPNIQKSENITSLVPSVVDLNTGEAGLEKLYTENIISSFKINMTTEEIGKVPIKASACVLRKLASYMVEKRAVISVPAYFSDPQRKATLKSAELAGIKVESLINEPTAAAIYYNKDNKDCSVIYDLGGGTFDTTVIDSRYGVYDVNVTRGRILGGDDLNKALLRRLYKKCGAKQHRLDDIMQLQMLAAVEQMKLEIQKYGYATLEFPEYSSAFDKTEFEMEAGEYKEIVKAVFGTTLIELRTVIASSGYKADDLKLILVGGSTRDPYLVDLIKTVKEPEPLTYNPDMIVAEGAAYYAYLLEQGVAHQMVSDVTKGLSIELSDGYVQSIIPENQKIPVHNSVILRNSITSDKLVVNLLQGNSGIAKNNVCIGKIIYDYGVVKEAGKGQVTITVNISADGVIKLSVKAPLKKSQELSITQVN